jgi:hypothetical protein
MTAVVHVELIGSGAATGPAVDALRSRAGIERVALSDGGSEPPPPRR